MPALRRWRQEGHKFKFILEFDVSKAHVRHSWDLKKTRMTVGLVAQICRVMAWKGGAE